MDIQAIIDQVMQALQNAPEKAGELLRDPRGTIEEVTGQTLGEGDLSQIVSTVKEKFAAGELDLSGIDLSSIDLSNLGGIGDLLGDSPIGGIVSGLGSLFGRK